MRWGGGGRRPDPITVLPPVELLLMSRKMKKGVFFIDLMEKKKVFFLAPTSPQIR
jgi:hypothetical protein